MIQRVILPESNGHVNRKPCGHSASHANHSLVPNKLGQRSALNLGVKSCPHFIQGQRCRMATHKMELTWLRPQHGSGLFSFKTKQDKTSAHGCNLGASLLECVPPVRAVVQGKPRGTSPL